MHLQINVAMPGYLPDGDHYPYDIKSNDLNVLVGLVVDEYDRSLPNDEPYPEDWKQTIEHIRTTLQEMENGVIAGFSDSLPDGKYAIEVERLD